MKRINDREVIVGPVRLSYLNVFAPKTNDLKDGAKEYSAVLLFPKTNTPEQPNAEAEVKEVRSALTAAVFAKWANNAPKNLRNPIRDGDTETDSQGEPRAPGYWFMNVSAKEQYPPLLIDGARHEAKASAWNSGDWGKVLVSIFAYDQKGNRGVSAGLRSIQFLSKGESMGGGAVSADAFDVEQTTATSPGQAPDEYDPFADE